MSGLPSSHLIPRSTFYHIGILVMVMLILTAFCAMGYLSVYDITRSWVGDINDKISIEIPAYNDNTKTIYSQDDINQAVLSIQKLLANDPIITNVKVEKIEIDNNGIDDKRFDIPSPVFITITLHPERAENAELRIINLIENSKTNAIPITQNSMQETIKKTAWILSTVFGGLAIAVFIITAIILSSTIRMQLKAQDEIIALIHLMGASTYDISKLFKNAITLPTVWGGFIGLGLCFMASTILLPLLNIHDKAIDFVYSLVMIFVFFVVLCRFVTHITVISTLRGLP